MRGRFWMAVVAMGVALAMLVPSVAPLSQSMDAFASDLANGTFRPFGAPPAAGLEGLGAFSASLGGLTGSSTGNYLPGAVELPPEWTMDRDGRPGNVVIDHVFDPSLGAMKRLKAYDRVDENGTLLEVEDPRLRVIERDPFLRYDTVFRGSFDVYLRPNEPVPIYSPHPRALVENARVDAKIDSGFSVFKDGADTYHVVADHEGLVTLNITYRADSAYYFFQPANAWRLSDYTVEERPRLAPVLAEDAQVVLARAGVRDTNDVVGTLQALNAYFRGFEEGDIPPPSEVESLYLALAVGENGCCRHRAFAYMITAQAAGIPTRVVVNEAHAFVEVRMPDERWYQINLGGCGTYTSNNPENHPSLFDQADDPRAEANPDEGRPIVERPSVTEITESPPRILKGERYFVNGTVLSLDGRPVIGARIDVFLNETKEAPGRLTGAGTTDANGRFSVEARVPKDLPARGYQLVARATDGRDGETRYEESWSDPPVDVFAPTEFRIELRDAAVGVPVSIPGRLLDVDGAPVANALVRWQTRNAFTSHEPGADNATDSGEKRTDTMGRFALNLTFPTTGLHRLTLAYDGSDHHGPASADETLRVEEGAILLPAEAPTLVRRSPTVPTSGGLDWEEAGRVTGRVVAGGAPVGGARIEVTFLGFGASVRADSGEVSGSGSPDAAVQTVARAATAADGSFDLPVLPFPETAPGAYSVVLTAPDLGLRAESHVRVAIQPTLTPLVPEAVRRDEPWVVEARLASDDGAPIRQGLVELTLAGNETSTRKLLTNSTGVARFELPERLLDDGTHEVFLRFAGDPDHVAAEAAGLVEVAGPAQLHVPAWVPLALVGGALLAGLLVHAFGRDGAGRRLLAHALAGGVLPQRRFLDVVFPDHPLDIAPVYEPGQPILVEVGARDRAGRSVPLFVHAEWSAGARATGRARRDASARLELASPATPRTVRLVVRARGWSRLWTRTVEREVLVASYREAIERAFVELRAVASLDASTTAWDLVAAVEPRLALHERDALREAAAIFDVADYSEMSVDRRSYHAFATARRSVQRAFEREDGSSGA